jgi:hypothetical protein
MQITWQQINEIAELAATKAVEKYKAEEAPLLFRTKTGLAKHLKCDRRTIYAMIERDEVVITQDGRYKINSSKPTK